MHGDAARRARAGAEDRQPWRDRVQPGPGANRGQPNSGADRMQPNSNAHGARPRPGADRLSHRCAVAFVLWLLAGQAAEAQVLALPARLPGSTGGARIMREIGSLGLEEREERIYAEIARGNIPSWLRKLEPVEFTRRVGGREYRLTVLVTTGYLAVGSDDDYVHVPLSPQTAQRIADLAGASLPTPPIVDAVWAAARVRLAPRPMQPGPEMTTVRAFAEHDSIIRAQRSGDDAQPGSLVAGHKKDVVLTPQLDSRPGRVAIYGWHRPDGEPIQPLYTGHSDRWVDYSHGIRLVGRVVLIDGIRHDMLDVLRDTTLAGLLSNEGAMAQPWYERTPVPAVSRMSTRRWHRFRPPQSGNPEA